MYNGLYIEKIAVFMMLLVMTVAGCKAPRDRAASAAIGTEDGQAEGSAVPKAVIYRMNGDYSDHVPVLINASRSHLISFPSPDDVSEYTKPVGLTGGWWLDRQGVGINTAFLSFTRDQYSSMDEPPVPDRIMESILPGAFVTETATLPVTVPQALANRMYVDSLISAGLPGIKIKRRMILYPEEPRRVDGTEH